MENYLAVCTTCWPSPDRQYAQASTVATGSVYKAINTSLVHDIATHVCTHTLQRYILLSYWWLYLHLEPVILCGMASFPWFMLRSQRTL